MGVDDPRKERKESESVEAARRDDEVMPDNVLYMEEWLRDTYRELHQMLRHIRTRLYALSLAQDASFQQEVADARKRLESSAE